MPNAKCTRNNQKQHGTDKSATLICPLQRCRKRKLPNQNIGHKRADNTQIEATEQQIRQCGEPEQCHPQNYQQERKRSKEKKQHTFERSTYHISGIFEGSNEKNPRRLKLIRINHLHQGRTQRQTAHVQDQEQNRHQFGTMK